MMKNSICFLLILLASCSAKSSMEKKILGSWTSEQGSSYQNQQVSDKITFQANDSFKFEVLWKGKVQSNGGKYRIDEEEKLLITEMLSKESWAEIMELTDTRLVLRQGQSTTSYKKLPTK